MKFLVPLMAVSLGANGYVHGAEALATLIGQMFAVLALACAIPFAISIATAQDRLAAQKAKH